jgi:hypothetical protein
MFAHRGCPVAAGTPGGASAVYEPLAVALMSAAPAARSLKFLADLGLVETLLMQLLPFGDPRVRGHLPDAQVVVRE